MESEGGWIQKRVFSSVTPPHRRSIASRHPLSRWLLLHQTSSGLSSGPRHKMLWTCPSSRCRERTASFSRPPERHRCVPGGPWRFRGFRIVCSSLVHFLWRVVFAVQGESVWVFECCCLLFFKGLLVLPWGYCSRNSYLCFSPAYRLLTGTTWKTLLIVCRLSTCCTAHGFQLSVPQCSFSCFIYFFNLFCIPWQTIWL